MSKARLDLEKDKFDSEGRVKVSIESNNVGSFNGEVTVNNTSSEPVPVSIINPSDAIDLQVEIQPNITIDDSTPIDVNVTNSSVNTNATIQNASLDVNLTDLDVNSRLPVSVDNQPTVTVDDATPIDVNVTNTVATNATIQNTNLDVTVQNAFQYVYDMVYDGASWRFQLSDTNGKAINLDHTYYTSTEITALGSSTDINLWLAAYNDSMLQYKYVGSYDDEFEVEVYLTHPDLGDGNKCLKLIFDYSTQNTKKVVKSVYASIVDWTFDDDVTGSLTVTTGTITSPDPNNAIAVGTDVCTFSVSNTGQGAITVSLSGTGASFYTLRNVTQGTTGSTLPYDSADSYVLETASDFSGASYTHSLTITATNDLYGNTGSVNVETSGTYSEAPAYANTYFARVTSSANAGHIETDSISMNFQTGFSISFWIKLADINTSYTNAMYLSLHDGTTDGFGRLLTPFGWQYRGSNNNYITLNGVIRQFYNSPVLDDGNWHHVALTWSNSGVTSSTTINNSVVASNLSMYQDGSAWNFANNSGTGTATGSTSFDKLRIGDITSIYTEPDFDISELAFWYGSTLTSAQVASIYNSGTPNDIDSISGMPSPSRYYLFEDNTDLSLDRISNTTKGTNSGAVRTAY